MIDNVDQCRACGAQTEVIGVFPSLPALANVFPESRSAARAVPRGQFRLVICPECGLIANDRFDPAIVEYDPGYENSLHYSGVFSRFTDELVHRLATDHALAGRLVVEPGCGKGDFLVQLCATAGCSGIGFDPAAPAESPLSEVRFVREHFTGEEPLQDAALVVSRHVLEHLTDPRGFLATIAASMHRSASALYLEVPDGAYMLRTTGLWDLVHEHVSYFTRPALDRLARAVGLEPIEIRSTFGGQFLSLDARAAETDLREPEDAEDRDELLAQAARFGDDAQKTIARWRSRVGDWSETGLRAVAWGAGSKGVTFCNLVDPDSTLAGIVDLNPRKQGRHVPGSGQPIIGPAALVDNPPDVVIVMNPQYRDEIAEALAAQGLAPELETVG